ncbi:ZnF_C3H1 [Seminavis robusta]|uniref:ZnF_C3H1 n=1 Tax=Seminavis robusta TaxID=568900 RepID=A0A9N8E706_9STRA|nr:ZnF_C3H1 [Seminavis robusta]|eukprot:Sro744_g196290.1 ZnF_C3H1 (360) ;mRNA; r:49311-50390
MPPQQPMYHNPALYPSNPIYPPPPPPPPANNMHPRKRKRDDYSNNNHHNTNIHSKKQQTYSCDICQVSADTPQALQAHLESHITCQKCDFQGAPKIVKAHFQSVHGKYSSGGFKTVTVAVPGCRVQRFRICVGNRPEDVQQWIAERKKRFPRKQQQQSQPQSQKDKDSTTTKDQKEEKASGVSDLLDGYGSSSSEDNDENDNNNAGQAKKLESTTTTVNSGETAINKNDIDKGNPSNEMDKNVQEEKKEDIAAAEKPNGYRTRICRYFARFGKCRNGDACTFLHERPNSANSSSSKKQQQQQQQRRQSTKEPPKSLLRSLLARDIQRETALTLQLLRYIVDQNFFQEEATNKNDDKTTA